MALKARICKSCKVNVDTAGKKGLRMYLCVCVHIYFIYIYIYNCKYITRSSKTFFFQIHTMFNKQPWFCLAIINKYFWLPKATSLGTTEGWNPIRRVQHCQLDHVGSGVPYVKVSKAARRTHHADIQWGLGWGGEFKRPQESGWLRNVRILNWFGSFIHSWCLKTKTSFGIYSTQPGREILEISLGTPGSER